MGSGILKKILLALLGIVAVLLALAALFPQQATSLAINLERHANGLEYKTTVVDGETWHYLEGGPSDADVLLLVHGFGGDKDNWTRLAGSLTDTFRVIAPDLPGFGETQWHADWDYSLLPQRDRLAALVEALELEGVHLAGNSMGGHLVALYAHEYPQKLASLTLVTSAGVTSPDESEFQRALAKGENPLVVRSPEDFDRLIEYASHKKPLIPWPMRGVLAQEALDRADKNEQVFAALMGDHAVGLEPLLGEIEMPVLIIWGEFDRIIDVSSVDVMLSLLPQAEAVVMEDTGHIPMLERPEATAAHYRQFLSGVSSSR